MTNSPQSGETLPPRRLFIPQGQRPLTDEFGFLRADIVEQAVSLADLLSSPSVLVTAPPWFGKTWVAKSLQRYFQGDPRKMPFVHRTSSGGFPNERPDWWTDWKQSNRRAVWLIDGVDDAARRNIVTEAILNPVESLTAEERARLTLFVFCRGSEIPTAFEQTLQEVYSDKLRRVQLAPLDGDSARELPFIKDSATFDKVCDSITKYRLSGYGGYPAVLSFLAKRENDDPITPSDVWRGVLIELLNDRDRTNPKLLNEQFDAVTRIAAALTFSREHQVLERPGIGNIGVTIERLFPLERLVDGRLRDAAELVTKSAIFERTAHGCRIVAGHVQEWLTAFAIKDAPLIRIRPLVADHEGKPFAAYKGILGLLWQITTQESVRRWLAVVNGGVAPRSDAIPALVDDGRRKRVRDEWHFHKRQTFASKRFRATCRGCVRKVCLRGLRLTARGSMRSGRLPT
ncbi:MAG TPA: hypothetical protein VM008_18130, partial [Phycisphaerae bacterium]|nr:hypothetical protein [Phycisphaerae bacterium]